MNVGNAEYYLQNKDYNPTQVDVEWDNLSSASTAAIFKSKFNKGMKINLNEGSIYSSPGIAEGSSYAMGLTIDQRAESNGSVVLAAGQNFAVTSNGEVKIKGLWEIWCAEDENGGTIGLDSTGVYANRKLDKDGKWVNIGSESEKWTSWEDLAGVARSFMELKVWNTVSDVAGFAADLLEIGGMAGLVGAVIVL